MHKEYDLDKLKIKLHGLLPEIATSFKEDLLQDQKFIFALKHVLIEQDASRK